MDAPARLARRHHIDARITTLLQKRTEIANEKFAQRVTSAFEGVGNQSLAALPALMDPQGWWRYAIDATQRSILFWETLWTRGNNYNENTAQGFKPVLNFDYDIVLDGRTFDRPVNYALLSIKPPAGVRVDPLRRPYIIIDPRAGHGPGIGGFKDDSQVGVALRAGHPVYFVAFYPEPEPGQTIADVASAEAQFLRKVHELHPQADGNVIGKVIASDRQDARMPETATLEYGEVRGAAPNVDQRDAKFFLISS